MEAKAYLVKEELFRFYLPRLNNTNYKQVDFNYVMENNCVLPMDQCKEIDISLTNQLQKAVSEQPVKTRGIAIRILANKDWENLHVTVTGSILRHIFILLGDQIKLRLCIGNPQVEVVSSNPSEPTIVTEMHPSESGGQINYSTANCGFPERWKKYWDTSLNIRFSTQVSLIVCGTVILPMTLEESFDNVDDIKQSIPKKLLEEKFQTDMALILDNGVHITCHKIFLQAQSSVFCSMMQKGKFLEGENNQVKMHDISECSVNALLEYLYYSGLAQPLKNPQVAVELLQASHKYDIKSLEMSMKSILMKKPAEWFDIPTTFKLFFFAKNVEELSQLKTKSLQILKSKKEEIVSSDEFKAMFDDDGKRTEGLELCSALLLAA